jgi:hypothetical protein
MSRKIIMSLILITSAVLLTFIFYCQSTPEQGGQNTGKKPESAPQTKKSPTPTAEPSNKHEYKTIHVFVCLCDNKNQGIVRVPEKIGNGQDSGNNLYWGAMYGVKTFFRKSGKWEEIPITSPEKNAAILDRAAFKLKNASPPVYVFAEAYDGACMREALTDFLSSAAGTHQVRFKSGETEIDAGGFSDAVCFAGHNGLMDMTLEPIPTGGAGMQPGFAAVLACKSRPYFYEMLRLLGTKEFISTKGFMAPEAYTLEAIIVSWASGDSLETIRTRAGEAYAKYQKISASAGINLFAADKLN